MQTNVSKIWIRADYLHVYMYTESRCDELSSLGRELKGAASS